MRAPQHTTIKELKLQHGDKISEPYTDKNGNLIREVNGVKTIQIKERTQEDRKRNENINLWRMRNL